MYSFSNLEPVHCSMSDSNCCFLTCIQISQEASTVVWYSHLFKNFLRFVVIHTVKGFGIVGEAEVDVFLEFSCFFYDPTDVGNLISGSSAFSISSLYIWKFSVHVLMKPSLKNFEHYFASMWNEPSCAVDETFLCPYGNLVKEGTLLKSAKAASNSQRDKIRWRISRTQCLKIGKRKMWVIFCISIMFIIAIFSTL